MGKGKKKKTGPSQEGAGSQRPPAEEPEAPDDGEASEGHPASRKDKRAAKKAAMKQARQQGPTSGEPSQPPDPSPVVSPPQQAEEVVERPREKVSPQSPIQEVPAGPPQRPAQVPSPEDQSMFSPPERQGGRGTGRGRSRGRGAEQGGGEVPGMRGRGDSRPYPQEQPPPPFQKGQGRARGRGPHHGPPPGGSFPPIGGAEARGPPVGAPPWQQAPPPVGVPPWQQPPPAQQVQQQQPPPVQQMPQQQPPPVQQMPPRGPPQRQQPGGPPPAQQAQARGPPPAQQAQARGPPQQAKDVESATKKMEILSLDSMNIPVRTEIDKGGTKGRKTVVDTNHLRLDLRRLKNKIAIHYDVEITPDRPKRLFRAAVEAFRLKHFRNRYPAFDGRKNLVAASYLPHLTPGEEFSDQVIVQDDERESTKEFTVKVKWVNEIDLSSLDRYMVDGSNLDLPQKAIQMLDIVIRSAPAQRFIQVGRSFFTQPEQVYPLGNGMHLWLGFYQSVILGWKPFLNVDVAHKGFPAPKNVRDIMDEVLGSYNNQFNPNKELNKYEEEDLSAFLKGLKVEYKLPNQASSKRTYRVNSVRASASKLQFKLDDGRMITVAEYFRREKNYDLRFPKLPCLHVGSPNRANPIFLPVELCTILPGQVTFRKMNEQQTSAMIKHAATSTDHRRGKIESAIRQANYNRDPGIQEFGIVVNDNFESVNARVLAPPQLTYGNQKEVTPRRGVWQPGSFSTGTALQSWWIINSGVNVRPEELWNFAKEMISVGRGLGMNISQPQDVIVLDRRDPPNKLFGRLDDCKRAGAQLAVVIIDDRRGVYAQVKQMAELQVGLLTQCLKRRTVSRQDRATVSNVLLKINSKLNGVNHKLSQPIRPPCLRRPVMIIGADVTHPSPDQRSIPSVAAVCASHDPDAFQYNLQYRLQSPRQEIIQDLKEIMKTQLKFFFVKTRFKPERIIFYRDGVSEGQFAMVLREELREIQAACREMGGTYEPPITFLVVQKRHHTRFFPTKPEDQDGKNKNVPAGTIVDTTITHPRHIDFYLVSHASIQGVSRPTKYRTLWDDSKMSVDELEQLTYYLCHLFSRCTRSVSYPAPTYYAHLAAYRARTYIEGQAIDLEKLSEEQAQRAIKEDVIKKFPMFFV